MAYLNDNNFLKNYASIIGPVIQPKILQAINGVNPNNLRLLLDDQTLFGLNKWPNDTFRNFEYSYKGKNYLDVIHAFCPDNAILITLDGDDFLASNDVLNTLNNIYKNKNQFFLNY